MVVQRSGSLVSSPPPPTVQPMPPMSKEVLYIGSAVPLETSNGLEAVQQPLRSRYPVNDEDIQGIPSILTVLPTGFQMKYVDDPAHVVFFPYSALNLCAAVRCVKMTNANNELVNKFVSLTESQNSKRPAIFTTITRRTQGRNVLECSGFLTKNPTDALDLVQWTSDADKRSKMNGGFDPVARASSSFRDANKANASFHTEMNFTEEDSPVNILSGNTTGTLGKPASYGELPKNGYFYTTENAQVKKFSLHKFSYQQGPAQPPPQVVQVQAADPVIESMPAPIPEPEPILEPEPSPVMVTPAPEPTPPTPVPVPIPIISQTLEEHQHERTSNFINGDHFDKRSSYSVPVSTRTPRLIAVRGPPPRPMAPFMVGPPPPPRPMLVPRPGPPPMRPVLVRAPPPGGPMMVRPAFYPVGHPGMGRARPIPVMMPMPMRMGFPPNATLPKNKPRRDSSSDSSHSSSSSTSRERSSKNHRYNNHQIVRRDHSFDSSSRPVTPPTDYDSPPPRRTSRRDNFQMRHSMMNGYSGGVTTLLPPRGRGIPPGYVMLPMPANGAIYGAPTLPRSKSVPPGMHKKSKKKSKGKKKSKKDKHNNHDYHFVGDITRDTDIYGYNSDIGPFGKSARPYVDNHHGVPPKPSLFNKMSSPHLGGSQYQKSFSKNAAERAFSTSLAAETRKSTRGDNMFNAYAMNQNGVPEGEFPTMR